MVRIVLQALSWQTRSCSTSRAIRSCIQGMKCRRNKAACGSGQASIFWIGKSLIECAELSTSWYARLAVYLKLLQCCHYRRPANLALRHFVINWTRGAHLSCLRRRQCWSLDWDAASTARFLNINHYIAGRNITRQVDSHGARRCPFRIAKWIFKLLWQTHIHISNGSEACQT